MATPQYWSGLTPTELSRLFDDQNKGKTLNRINERTFLLNNIGDRLQAAKVTKIEDVSRVVGALLEVMLGS